MCKCVCMHVQMSVSVCVSQERSEGRARRADTVFRGPIADITGSPGGSVAKNLPANARAVRSILGSRRPLEEEMATHSSTFAWRIPWTEEPCGLQSMGPQESRT